MSFLVVELKEGVNSISGSLFTLGLHVFIRTKDRRVLHMSYAKRCMYLRLRQKLIHPLDDGCDVRQKYSLGK